MAQPKLGRHRDDLRADTVVIGGGIAGFTLAHRLASRGAGVRVIERGGIGAGASGRNGGFLFRQPAEWINDHIAETLELYGELADEGSVDLGFEPRTQLVLAVEPDELPHARAYADAVGGEEVDLREDDWFAPDLAGGYAVGGAVSVDAMATTTATAEAARRAGAELQLGSEAKRILVARGRVTGVATDHGVVRAERVIVACGPRTRFVLRTAGVDLPISSARGWILETEPLDRPPPYAIEQALWPAQDEMARMVVDPTLAEVAAGELERPSLVSLLMGARPAGQCIVGTSLSRSLLEETEGADTVPRLAERAVRVSPHMADVRVAAAWSGRRAMTPDGLPAVGPVPGVDGLEVAAGFSSIGMMVAPAACRRLADGEPEPAHDPARLVA